MIVGNYEKFCKDYHLCEGYENAINSSEEYFLHHIQGEYMSKEELLEYDWYFDCHPSCLKWVTKTEHNKIHSRCMRFESRKKIGAAHKGKVLSDETKRKLSEVMKGKNKGRTSPNKGKSWKLVDGKRIWYKKEYSSYRSSTLGYILPIQMYTNYS